MSPPLPLPRAAHDHRVTTNGSADPTTLAHELGDQATLLIFLRHLG